MPHEYASLLPEATQARVNEWVAAHGGPSGIRHDSGFRTPASLDVKESMRIYRAYCIALANALNAWSYARVTDTDALSTAIVDGVLVETGLVQKSDTIHPNALQRGLTLAQIKDLRKFVRPKSTTLFSALGSDMKKQNHKFIILTNGESVKTLLKLSIFILHYLYSTLFR